MLYIAESRALVGEFFNNLMLMVADLSACRLCWPDPSAPITSVFFSALGVMVMPSSELPEVKENAPPVPTMAHVVSKNEYAFDMILFPYLFTLTKTLTV